MKCLYNNLQWATELPGSGALLCYDRTINIATGDFGILGSRFNLGKLEALRRSDLKHGDTLLVVESITKAVHLPGLPSAARRGVPKACRHQPLHHPGSRPLQRHHTSRTHPTSNTSLSRPHPSCRHSPSAIWSMAFLSIAFLRATTT